ncbi:MAG TPA: Ig-like domain repeat protein [Baekduia sp.]|nr:Ig-like domain repeat protein [Baekduia sp.]
MTSKFLGLLVGSLVLAAFAAGPTSALASKVSVEIEGQSVIQAPAAIDTAASVNKPGGASCSGSVPATALETAVGGDWDGPSYAVTRIKGEEHPFGPGGSWSFYINGLYSNDTVCTAPLKDGDKVLLYWTNAYAQAGYDEPVTAEVPATVTPGAAFTVTAHETTTSFDGNGTGTSAIAPSADATISGGVATATTGADGTASVTVPGGPYTLVVTKGNRAPARIVGCATSGSDGFCGTTQAAQTAPPAACAVAGSADDGFCGRPDRQAARGFLTGITEGMKYKKGRGPRQLTGRTEPDGSGLADVRLRLTRNDKGDCSTYDAKTEKFTTLKKCGATHGTWFSVGSQSTWSYLLPAKLARGRYVLDLQIVDKAGNKTAGLARGATRVVFTVA